MPKYCLIDRSADTDPETDSNCGILSILMNNPQSVAVVNNAGI
ncbi:hypothetical protein D1BOALGB6SA_698 [Olavius sp. associated proteobacterium Delta 1]|nr:hypothetical protein D1BOALGB6SA_698 [Olavius sp. associated proteobacterium Delta 1]